MAKHEKNSHSKYLAPMVDELLQRNSLTVRDLSALALGDGPGSYTGLRIGASFAKAICYTCNVPLIPVSSLKAIAQGLKLKNSDSDIYVAMIDARRMDAYVGVYDHGLEIINETFETLNDGLLSSFDGKKILIGGSASLKFKEQFDRPSFEYMDIPLLAEHMITDAFKMFNKKEYADVAYYEPNYIKSVHITAKKQTKFN